MPGPCVESFARSFPINSSAQRVHGLRTGGARIIGELLEVAELGAPGVALHCRPS
jgi:hypothetical protein